MQTPSIPKRPKGVKRDEWEKIVWKKVVKDLFKVSSLQKLQELLDLIIGENEKHAVLIRLAILDRLKRGTSYRAISKEFWVSHVTISSIKKSFQNKTFKSYWLRTRKQQEDDKQTEKFIKADKRRYENERSHINWPRYKR